jgi:hypothetical protein
MTQRDNLIGRSLRLSALAAYLAAVPSLVAQAKPSAAIPATAPTQSVSDLPSAHPAVRESTPRGESHINWNGSKLTVNAGGDALPEILQRIARETGMKITGGVPDERVFGTYGPGSVQMVMGQLFDGLAINMMLINGSETTPKELVLTARSGAASPPQVRQVSNDDESSPRRSNPMMPVGQQPARGFGSQPPRGQGPGGQAQGEQGGPPPNNDGSDDLPSTPASATTAVPNNTAADTNSPPATGADQEQSPNGVRTPEQIFEELRKRQQEQQQATPQ